MLCSLAQARAPASQTLPAAAGAPCRAQGRPFILPARPAVALAAAFAPSGTQTLRRERQQRQQQRRRSLHRVCAMSGQDKTKVLFVCLGNICRSPSAEAVFKNVVERAGVSGEFEIDSCGTGGGSRNWYMPGGFSYHEGDPADSRMTATAAQRGVKLTSRSRPLRPADFAEFDHIIGMDASNIAAIQRAAEYWRKDGAAEVPADYGAKLSLMTDYLRDKQFASYNEVPDPYYGGQRGFELVLDLLDDACQGLLERIRPQQ